MDLLDNITTMIWNTESAFKIHALDLICFIKKHSQSDGLLFCGISVWAGLTAQTQSLSDTRY